jgi:hypothetical protein
MLDKKETEKVVLRSEVINVLLESLNRECTYLEIGVRNPSDNYDKIISADKYSVDPGIEFKKNPVDFKFASDVFFEKLRKGEVLNTNIKFDVIFIDGLHLANQVNRDIENALEFIKEDGFIVLHDCNPPTEWHAREEHNYRLTPAGSNWNGTTWKAFYHWRKNKSLFSCCVDTDWGVGIISKTKRIGKHAEDSNTFFDFKVLEQNRKESLNLISMDHLISILTVST